MSALFGSMRYLGILRVHIEEEALGMDTALCGAPGAAGAIDFRDAKVPGATGMGVWMPPLPFVQPAHGRLSNFVEEGGGCSSKMSTALSLVTLVPRHQGSEG